MKIEKSGSPLPSPSVSESAVRTTPNKSAEASKQPAGVNVSLGSTTSQLRSMESNMANASVVDSKKVAEIKQAISEGRFQINSSAIADSLINNVKDLIVASRR